LSLAPLVPCDSHLVQWWYQVQSNQDPWASCQPSASTHVGALTRKVKFLTKSCVVEVRTTYQLAPSTGPHDSWTEASSKIFRVCSRLCCLLVDGPVRTRRTRKCVGDGSVACAPALRDSKQAPRICKPRFKSLAASAEGTVVARGMKGRATHEVERKFQLPVGGHGAPPCISWPPLEAAWEQSSARHCQLSAHLI